MCISYLFELFCDFRNAVSSKSAISCHSAIQERHSAGILNPRRQAAVSDLRSLIGDESLPRRVMAVYVKVDIEVDIESALGIRRSHVRV